jgi:hypothetical protein
LEPRKPADFRRMTSRRSVVYITANNAR